MQMLRKAAAISLVLPTIFSQASMVLADETFPPVPKVEGHSIYKAGTNSVPDAAGAKAGSEMLAPVTNFMDYLAKTLDSEGNDADIASAYKQLKNWAKNGALLEPPDTPGRVSRVWITTGLGLLILKFKARGVVITGDVAKWYLALAGAVYKDYSEPLKKGGYNGLYSNVYPWAGASEAIAALLTGNPEAHHIEDVVWTRMLSEVQPDGTLQGELGRGQRSLEYHIRTADGLLILRAVRRSLGEHDHQEQGECLRRLLGMIGDSLCDPSKMARLAGSEQEKPGDWGFRISAAFGGDILPDSWKRCAPEIKSWGTGEYGGDARVAVAAIKSCALQGNSSGTAK